MSGMGVQPWTEAEWDAYEVELERAGYEVDHCGHCDRSNRHPSCLVVPIQGREQLAYPKPDRSRYHNE